MEQTLSVTTTDEKKLPVGPVSVNDIGLLDQAEAAPMDLMSDYWSPENMGECKKVLFDGIETMAVVDQTSGEVMDLECAFFYTRDPHTNAVKRIRNGSKRLVAALATIPPRTPLLITYLGKKTNKTNSFKSDNWSIKPLIVHVPPQA